MPWTGSLRSTPRRSRLVAARRGFIGTVALLVFVFALTLLSFLGAPAFAQGDAPLPGTTIAPAGEGGAVETPLGAPSGPPEVAEPTTFPTPRVLRHHTAHRHAASHHTASVSSESSAVEPAKAKLVLKEDSWAYASPAKSSQRIEQVHSGKFVNVTGLTRSYVQVRLKSGATAYVPISAVDLTRPADKIFTLTSDASVLSEPSHYGKKVSEVHRGHSVHVIGIALNYVKIKMRNGVEGYVPLSALQ